MVTAAISHKWCIWLSVWLSRIKIAKCKTICAKFILTGCASANCRNGLIEKNEIVGISSNYHTRFFTPAVHNSRQNDRNPADAHLITGSWHTVVRLTVMAIYGVKRNQRHSNHSSLTRHVAASHLIVSRSFSFDSLSSSIIFLLFHSSLKHVFSPFLSPCAHLDYFH